MGSLQIKNQAGKEVGTVALSDDDFAYVQEEYPSFSAKVAEALRFADLESPLVTDSLCASLHRAGFDYNPDTEHLEIVRRIREKFNLDEGAQVSDLMLRAASIRRFLG